MRGLVLFGDLFEDTELIATIDVLIRHREEITLASAMGRKEVKSKNGIAMKADALIEEVNLDDFDFLFIPGGPGAFQILNELSIVNETISAFVRWGKTIATICAAPFLVGRLGYLRDKNYTVHPGFESQIQGGCYLRDQGVVEDGLFITAKSMFYSVDLGLKIVEHFYGEEERNRLMKSLKGE